LHGAPFTLGGKVTGPLSGQGVPLSSTGVQVAGLTVGEPVGRSVGSSVVVVVGTGGNVRAGTGAVVGATLTLESLQMAPVMDSMRFRSSV